MSCLGIGPEGHPLPFQPAQHKCTSALVAHSEKNMLLLIYCVLYSYFWYTLRRQVPPYVSSKNTDVTEDICFFKNEREASLPMLQVMARKFIDQHCKTQKLVNGFLINIYTSPTSILLLRNMSRKQRPTRDRD